MSNQDYETNLITDFFNLSLFSKHNCRKPVIYRVALSLILGFALVGIVLLSLSSIVRAAPGDPGTVDTYQKIADNTGGFNVTLTDGDTFGSSVVEIGDLNGDGILDLAVGAPSDDTGANQAGAAYIQFMKADGTVSATQKIANDSGLLTGTLTTTDFFGSGMASIGDLNDDQVPDLAVGAFRSGADDTGAVYILFLETNGTVISYTKIASGTSGLASDSLDANGFFGFGMTGIGDLNGDQIPDLAVGAYRDNTNGSQRGAVYILFMKRDGTVDSYQKIADNTGGFNVTLMDSDHLGISVANIGDLNGDDVTDLVAGAYGDDTGGGFNGSVYVLFMQSDGTVSSTQKIANGTGGLITGTISGAAGFGIATSAVGDLNNDGVTDLAVGASTEDTGGNNRGAVFILFLKADGTVDSFEKIADNTGGFNVTLANQDQFGHSVAGISDLNSDGKPELAVGARLDGTGGNQRGALYVLFLNALLPPDLSLNKTVDPGTAGPGGSITYTISFSNSGLMTATNVVITDSVPVSVTHNSLNVSSSGATITATVGSNFVWQVQDLAPGQGGIITVTGQLSNSLPHDHVFMNTAVIASAGIDSEPGDNSSSISVTIDAAAPDPPTLLSPADNTISNSTELTLSWAASVSAAGYWLNLQGMASDVGNVTSASTGLLPDGTYTWTVAAYDAFNNTSPYTDVWSFTVDASPPDTTITANPPDPDNNPTPSFQFTGNDGSGSGVASFACQLDNGGWATCTSPHTTSSLGDGLHTFEVRATDNAGNTDATPASYSWTVDITLPAVTTVSPADGASDVPRNLPLEINFDEPMDTATVSFLITPTVTGLTETWTNGDSRLTLIHDELAANTTYTTTISAGNDLASNPLANAPYTWVFTTGNVSAPVADLALSKTRIGTGNVMAGDRITYTLTISNGGPTVPVSGTLVDTFSEATALAAVSGAGCNWISGSAVVTCTLTNITSDDPVQLTLVVTTSSSYSGTLSNSATVSLAGGIIDPNLDNNDAGPVLVTIVPSTNSPPTISDIPDQSTNMDQAVGPISFTIADAETPAANLTLSGASSNTALVPVSSIGFGGSGMDRTLTITPTTGLTGTAIITVIVSDGDLQASDVFTLMVNEIDSGIYLPLIVKN